MCSLLFKAGCWSFKMAPRDGGSNDSLAGGSTSLGDNIDWPWIDTLDLDRGMSARTLMIS